MNSAISSKTLTNQTLTIRTGCRWSSPVVRVRANPNHPGSPQRTHIAVATVLLRFPNFPHPLRSPPLPAPSLSSPTIFHSTPQFTYATTTALAASFISLAAFFISFTTTALAKPYNDETLTISPPPMKLKIVVTGFSQFILKSFIHQGHTVLPYSRSDHTSVTLSIGVAAFFSDLHDLCEQIRICLLQQDLRSRCDGGGKSRRGSSSTSPTSPLTMVAPPSSRKTSFDGRGGSGLRG